LIDEGSIDEGSSGTMTGQLLCKCRQGFCAGDILILLLYASWTT
jgi:hypothetical protein